MPLSYRSKGSVPLPDMICQKPEGEAHGELVDDVLLCMKCPGLNIHRETEGAPGYGSTPADLMVVGQSLHGYNAETPKIQIPFVGPVASMDSGVVLYEILRQAGYTIWGGNLYVTNVVKCHPPKNRPSSMIEVENCSPYLVRELEFVKPKIVLMVGSSARDWFIKKEKLAVVPGGQHIKEYRKVKGGSKDRLYFTITHPSAILRYHSAVVKKEYSQEAIDKLVELREGV